MSKESQNMHPMSRDRVEVDGVYANEWGREEVLFRGQTFPSDPQLGATEYELKQFIYDNHHEGKTDERLVPKANNDVPQNQNGPRLHGDGGDK